MDIKIGCHTITWGKNPDVERMLVEVKEAGFDGVEFFQSMEMLGSPRKLRKLLERVGLAVVSFGGAGVSLKRGDKKITDAGKRGIDYAAYFNVRVVTSVCGWRSPDKKISGEDYTILAENLEEIASYAAQYKINIAYHPHIGTIVETDKEIDRLLSKIELVKLCPDTAHLMAVGSDPIEVIRKHRDRVGYIHLKDWDSTKGGKYDFGKCAVELGKGNIGIDIPKVMLTLNEIGYKGWVTVELDNTETTPFKSAKISRDYLKEIGY